MGQAGQTTREIGISRGWAGPGRQRARLKSRRPGQASARAVKVSRAGTGTIGAARPDPTRES